MAEVVRILNDVAGSSEVNALTIAEPMPRTTINIKNMLEGISILGK